MGTSYKTWHRLTNAVLDAAGHRVVTDRVAAVLDIHKPVPEQMLDEDASIAENDEVLVDVMVCAHCCHLAYPEGCEDYYDPDVFWPCPTARAVGVIPQGEPE